MTDKEKIEVMQAHIEGKLIQCRHLERDNWKDVTDPVWNWRFWEYRVKPEPKKSSYRPFKDIAELVEWWEKHYCDKNRPEHTMPLVWVKFKDDGSTEDARLITEFWNDGVIVGSNGSTTRWQDLFEKYTFLDGKPCGVEE